MSDLEEAISRLTAWVRDYGAEKQKPFIDDVKAVLAAAQETVSLQSLVREYLEACDACDDAETKYAVHYDDSDVEEYHNAMCQAIHKRNAAEQALRAALPN